MKNGLITLTLMLLLGACATNKATDRSHQSVQEHMVLATAWTQSSAEWHALCLQSFELAKLRLKEALARKKSKKPAAVIVDIDETILDNSPFQARSILDGTSYPIGWTEWVEEAKATFIPGAKEFILEAQNKGVKIIYVSNRKVKEGAATFKNLINLGVKVEESDLYLRDKESGKGIRRKKASELYDVVLLMGDNLADFDDMYDAAPIEKRLLATQAKSEMWGKKWIVLPNPMYGDWEGAIYDYNFIRSDAEKSAMRQKILRTAR